MALKQSLRAACIQMNAVADWKKNLAALHRLTARALRQKVQLIVFPENCIARSSSKELPRLAREVTPRAVKEFQKKARAEKVAFLLGSLIEASRQKNLFYNTSFLISEKGRIAAKYRKIHLFDVQLKGKVQTQESRHILAGRKVVTGKVWGVPVGLTICYDLRFPELFRHLAARRSRIIFVPANFTKHTGQAHWEVLLKARAIENQVFVLAPAQVGVHPATKIESFGTSLIIDPWGRVLQRGGLKSEQVLVSRLDLAFQAQLRRNFPVLQHKKLA